jgi:hypothetical protein
MRCKALHSQWLSYMTFIRPQAAIHRVTSLCILAGCMTTELARSVSQRAQRKCAEPDNGRPAPLQHNLYMRCQCLNIDITLI